MTPEGKVMVKFAVSLAKVTEQLARTGKVVAQACAEIHHQGERLKAAETLRLARIFAEWDPNLHVYTQTVDGQCRVVVKRLGGWA